MKTIAVIPARSGSVGVRDKNIRQLGDKPLLVWAIEAAKQSALINKLIVSTDSVEYAALAKSHGAEVPFLRPAKLAEDVPSEDVLLHALDEMKKKRLEYDLVACIQCTTPLVNSQDIDLCIKAAQTPDVDSAITVTKISERPEWMFSMNGATKELHPEYTTSSYLRGDWGIRQSFMDLYRPNGACYVTKVDFLRENKRIIGDTCLGIEMPRFRSFDIDTEEDFALLDSLIKMETIRKFV